MHHIVSVALSHSLDNLFHHEFMQVKIELGPFAFIFEVEQVFRTPFHNRAQLKNLLVFYDD